jgi:hypothetical protein
MRHLDPNGLRVVSVQPFRFAVRLVRHRQGGDAPPVIRGMAGGHHTARLALFWHQHGMATIRCDNDLIKDMGLSHMVQNVTDSCYYPWTFHE